MYAKVGRLAGAVGVNPLRADKTGALCVMRGGDFKDNTLGGTEFFAFCASQNVALFSATAAIGLIVYNPIGSGVNAVFGKYCINVWATSATTTGFVLAVQAQTITPTSVTAATAWGKTLMTPPTFGSGQCLAYSVGTLQTAPLMVWNLAHNTAAIASTGIDNISGDLQGALAIGPGNVALIGALGVAAVTANIGLMWEEVPLVN